VWPTGINKAEGKQTLTPWPLLAPISAARSTNHRERQND
jgi:hypothetical protein